MQYLLLFLEGVITFISPCFLPLLPVYLSYCAGKAEGKAPLLNAISFVLGFTVVFVAMGAFAGSIGGLLREYGTLVNIVTGLVVVLFGLTYLGIINKAWIMDSILGLFRKFKGTFFIHEETSIQNKIRNKATYSSSFLFGIVFSVSWTPCVGAFLGAALLRAAQQGTMPEGMLMLLVFSAGLGVPFIVSSLLINHLKGAFLFVKQHYRIINAFSGGLLIILGILMMTGVYGRFVTLFAL